MKSINEHETKLSNLKREIRIEKLKLFIKIIITLLGLSVSFIVLFNIYSLLGLMPLIYGGFLIEDNINNGKLDSKFKTIKTKEEELSNLLLESSAQKEEDFFEMEQQKVKEFNEEQLSIDEEIALLNKYKEMLETKMPIDEILEKVEKEKHL